MQKVNKKSDKDMDTDKEIIQLKLFIWQLKFDNTILNIGNEN